MYHWGSPRRGEDTAVTLDDLRAAGFSANVVEAVALTHRRDEIYVEYIERVARNPVASAVKLVDLDENLRNNERPPSTPATRDRIMRYRQAITRLSSSNA